MSLLVLTRDKATLELLKKSSLDHRVLNLSIPLHPEDLRGFNHALLDIDMPLDMALLKELVRYLPVTAFGKSDITKVVDAIKVGADDFIKKPLTDITINKLITNIKGGEKNTDESFSQDLVGKSPQMQDVLELIRRAALSDSNVLITGESGTGKEPAASLIHKRSPRRERLFMTINCSAIPDTLLESELFGFEKGAFTGANYTKKGILELANGGTVFLDEIGDVSNLFQSKILRVLQEGEIMRIGAQGNTKIDVRFIAATNKDLKQHCRRGTFREDLFYRLNVINIHMPPLRERKEDIPLLVEHFIRKYSAKRRDIEVSGISPEALQILMNYQYQGNVRELENLIERAVSFTDKGILDVPSLPPHISSLAPKKTLQANRIKERLQTYEREIIWAALQDAQGNITKAALALGLHRQELQRKLRRFKIAT